MINYWFTSDTHWCHWNIVGYCNRPFSNIRDHDETLINNWNSVVGLTDHVYHLGDFGFGSKGRMISILSRLNGKIHLIRGNHDKSVLKEEVAPYFVWIKDYYELFMQGKQTNKNKIVLCHYPFQTWNKSHRGAWHLHGHCHGGLDSAGMYRLDVGVDSVADILGGKPEHYRPISFEEVAEIMSKK